MANPKWLPKTPDGRKSRLTEEMGEVLQCLGKAERFGLDTRYCKRRHRPVQDRKVESNREALIRELHDLQIAATEVLRDLHTFQ